MTSRTSTVFASSNTSRPGNGKSVIGRSIPAAIPSLRPTGWPFCRRGPRSRTRRSRSSRRRACTTPPRLVLADTLILFVQFPVVDLDGVVLQVKGFHVLALAARASGQRPRFLHDRRRVVRGRDERLLHLADDRVPRIMAGVRYLSARSNASMVRVYISCTECGARTIRRYPPWPPPLTAWK